MYAKLCAVLISFSLNHNQTIFIFETSIQNKIKQKSYFIENSQKMRQESKPDQLRLGSC